MKKIIICCAVFGTLTFGSCKKLLDKTPEDSVATTNFFTKENDAVLALNGVFDVYSDRGSFYAGSYKDRGMASDDFFTILTGAFPANHNHIPSSPDATGLWRLVFTAIERANILLANLDKIPMDANKREIIRGEALFMRAHSMCKEACKGGL